MLRCGAGEAGHPVVMHFETVLFQQRRGFDHVFHRVSAVHQPVDFIIECLHAHFHAGGAEFQHAFHFIFAAKIRARFHTQPDTAAGGFFVNLLSLGQ
jgi:hypothetical protein